MAEDLFEIARKRFFGEATPDPDAPPAERFKTSRPFPSFSSDEQGDPQVGANSYVSGARAEGQSSKP